MLNEQDTKLISDIAAAVGKSAEYVTEHYSTWFFSNAIGWIVLGALICWGATRIRFDADSEVAQWAQGLIRGVVALIGALFILANAPDLASPKAAAVHQLLKDVSPHK